MTRATFWAELTARVVGEHARLEQVYGQSPDQIPGVVYEINTEWDNSDDELADEDDV